MCVLEVNLKASVTYFFRPANFLPEEVEEMIQWICKFLLDPFTFDSQVVIALESTLSLLLLYFSSADWPQTLARLCKQIYSPQVASYHKNFLSIIQHIPLIHQQGKELASTLSTHLLLDILKTTNYSVSTEQVIVGET